MNNKQKEIIIYDKNYNENLNTKIREGSRGIIVRDNKILIAYESKTNQLMIPGGGVEKDESLEECLLREIEEETGYQVKICDKVVTIKEYYNDNIWINHYYSCEIISIKKAKLTENEKEERMTTQWVDINECLNTFKTYSYCDFSNENKYKQGLYKREYLALEEYFNYANLEVWDLYDINRNKLNKEHIRETKLPEGCYHLVVHAWIKNSKDQYLISKRSKTRKANPLLYECVGGSVIKNENTYEGAIREAKEEVGIDLTNCPYKHIKTVTRKEFLDILDVYVFDYDGPALLSLATTDEVEKVEWMTKSQITCLFNEGKFVHTLKYFLDYQI